MSTKKVPQRMYQVYHRQLADGNVTAEQYVQCWWRGNVAHSTLAAQLVAPSAAEAGMLAASSGTGCRACREGDVMLGPEGETWMRLSGTWVQVERPQDAPLQRTSQHSAILSVVWSPDGRRFAACGKQGLVRVSTLGKRGESTYETHAASAQALAWSPDGTRMATGDSDNALHLWEVAEEEGERRRGDASIGRMLICRDRQDHPFLTGVYAAAWSPTVPLVVADGTYQGEVRLWDVSTGTCVWRVWMHEKAVRAVAWSPDGTRVVSAGDDATIQLWDADARRPLWKAGAMGSIAALAWLPNGDHLLVGGPTDQRLSLYRASDGLVLETIPLSVYAQQKGMLSVAVAPDGRAAVAGCADGSVQIVDLCDGGRPLQVYHGHRGPVQTVAWSPNGTHLVSGGRDAAVLVWPVPASVSSL